MKRPLKPIARLVADRDGASAVEFALLGPIFCLVIAVAVDIGGALLTKHRLDASVAAAVNYAQVNAASVTPAGATALAGSVASIVQASQGAGWANVSVTVNNGPVASANGGPISNTGSSNEPEAAKCFCPTGTTGAFAWGVAKTCGSQCTGTNAGYAGKFVNITATKTYTPLISTYSLVQNPITVTATVQVQ